jgi:protease II
MKSDLITINLTLNQIQAIIDRGLIAVTATQDQALACFPDGNWTEYDFDSVTLAQSILYFKNLHAGKCLELNLTDTKNTIDYLNNRKDCLEIFYQKMTEETEDITLALANIHSEIIRLRKQVVVIKKTEFSVTVPAEIYNSIIKFGLDK